MNEKYDDGICEICGKVFSRPNKFRTETESSHEKDCRLNEIEEIIESGEGFNKFEVIDDLKNISKVSSFGGRFKEGTNIPIRNKYYLRMIRCKKLMGKLEGIK